MKTVENRFSITKRMYVYDTRDVLLYYAVENERIGNAVLNGGRVRECLKLQSCVIDIYIYVNYVRCTGTYIVGRDKR